MRSAKIMTLKLFPLAALLVGAAFSAGCGGGGGQPAGSTLLLGSPVLAPPATPPAQPDPIPMPPSDGAGSPVDPVEPPPVVPVEPPAEEPPHEDPPPAVQSPDFANVRAIALVGVNAALADAPEAYTGLYAGDADGGLWRRHEESGDWRQVGTMGIAGSIEAMTYVPERHALYLTIDTHIRGFILARWLLTPTAPVIDDTVEPPVVVDEGGEQFQLIRSAGNEAEILGAGSVTGLACDTVTGRLYGWDHDARSLVDFPDLDVAGAAVVRTFSLVNGLLGDVQGLAYDRENAQLLAVDAAMATLVELDHLGLAVHIVDTDALSFTGLTDLAWEESGMRLAVDRDGAALVRFDRDGGA